MVPSGALVAFRIYLVDELCSQLVVIYPEIVLLFIFCQVIESRHTSRGGRSVCHVVTWWGHVMMTSRGLVYNHSATEWAWHGLHSSPEVNNSSPEVNTCQRLYSDVTG